ncbi:MAG: radical SAM protein [Candidatus Woesearchaeota archaeon]
MTAYINKTISFKYDFFFTGCMGYDIVLVQPKAGRWEKLGVRQPESLLTIAAVPFQKGYKIKILDTRIEKNWKEVLGKILNKNPPVCVGITSMTGVQIKNALEVSRFVKRNSNVPVVWGGVHASLLPEQTLENKNIDIVIVREGDYAFCEVFENLRDGKSLEDVKGIYYKKDGKVIKNPPRELIKNLDELPVLPYELIDLDKYYAMNTGEGKSITMTTSRGCPHRCTFCYNTSYYCNRWRAMSAPKVIDRIKYVVEKFGIKTIFFHDDNFSVDLNRVDEITKGIIDQRIDIKWGLLGTRIDTIERMSDELLNQLINAGCINIDIGIESGSERILQLMKKDITIPKIIEVNKRLAKYKIISKYTFIVGFPTETKKDLNESINLALRLTKDNRKAYTPFFIFTLYPGTQVFELAMKNGYIEPNKLSDWISSNFEEAFLNYPWLTKKRIKMIRNLEFTSNFANKNIKYKINNNMIRILFNLYYPFARYRFKNNFYHLPIEMNLAHRLS